MSQFAAEVLRYEDRVVAFVDILGWKNAVLGDGVNKARTADELGWLLQIFLQQERSASAASESTKKFRRLDSSSDFPPFNFPRITQFSDCIVISTPASDSPDDYWTFNDTLHRLCALACQNGFLLRGGVARGAICHLDRIVYGPALVEAYEIEKYISIYPRIVVSKELISILYPGARYFENGKYVGHGKYWRRDVDGMVFFDYLAPIHVIVDISNKKKRIARSGINILDNYKKVICQGIISNPHESRVLEKYYWTSRYFDKALKEYPNERLTYTVVKAGEHLIAYDRDEWPHWRPDRNDSESPNSD
ncbi:MAG: hypothetical protein KKH72_14825 [Alphaproteobacteria bacterium]|nr:hypothetical protein [Alphaproteobacteria bacterium]